MMMKIAHRKEKKKLPVCLVLEGEINPGGRLLEENSFEEEQSAETKVCVTCHQDKLGFPCTTRPINTNIPIFYFLFYGDSVPTSNVFC
jgi:hypothetical protein